MRLTDASIKALPVPQKGQRTYIDSALPNFGLRVSQGGIKSFVVVMGRTRQRLTIGRYPLISLQAARGRAKELLAERVLGKHRVPTLRFEEAITLFLETYFPINYPKPSYKKEVGRQLNRYFLPALRHERLDCIQPHMIARIIDRMYRSPGEARHAFGTIRLFFNWAARRGYVQRSPCEHLRAPGKPGVRDRVLSALEVRKVINQARTEDTMFNNIVQLLLLTGQRRGEIAALEAEWIDFANRTITLPATLTKNKRQHRFPFGSIAEEILRNAVERRKAVFAALDIQPKRIGCLFPARGTRTPFAGWSKCKPAFDRACALDHWVLHDLRRTCATNLAALGTPIQVTEKLLNHVSGATGGIVAIYQRHAYFDEMRDAMERWEAYLAVLVGLTGLDVLRPYVLRGSLCVAA